jgi:LysR family cys regulon transcriptional activator
MNFQQLRSVREAIRRDFNLTEVANALYTSQPGVSRQIRELEDELGIEIFERNGKRLVGLTEPGTEILRIVERLLLEAENLKRAGAEFTNRATGELVIATTHNQARYRLPQAIKAFRERFPGVRLALHQQSPERIVEALREGTADIGIATESLAQEPELVAFPSYEWNHVVVVPRDHPLAAAEQPGLDELARHPLITYDSRFAGRKRIDAAFAHAGLAPEVVLTAMDADVIKTYVNVGLGVGIIASMALDPERDVALHAIDAGYLFGANVTRIAVRKGAYLRGFAYDFIEHFAPQLTRAAMRTAIQAE